MVMLPFTIPKTCLLVGMESPFLIGCTSFMVSISSTSAKYAVTSVIGDRVTSIAIFKSECSMHMKFGLPAFVTFCVKMASQLRHEVPQDSQHTRDEGRNTHC
jgi:hypothetical protein